MKIGVIGAGVVGCASAYALVRAGHEVHLLDKEPGPGRLTSKANGAQLSYSYVQPFATPQTLAALPSMLLSADAAVRWTPRWDWAAWKWQMAFLWACRPAQVKRGTEQLLELAFESRDTLARWAEDEAWEIGHRVAGKIVLCTTPTQWRAQQQQVALQAQMGCRQELLTAAQCVAIEPTLAHYQSNIMGGIWTPDEAIVDPYRLCHALVRSFEARGGVVHWSCEAAPLAASPSAAGIDVQTPRGVMHFDRLVLAAGPLATSWAQASGLGLNVQPIKGYSLTLDLKPGQTLPRCSITDLSLKTVFAPLNGSLRVAAMAELVGQDGSIPEHRLAQIIHSVETVFPGMCRYTDNRPWTGLRPATPDSLPIIGASARPNLYFNVGQGALGLTLAAGSAMRLVQALERSAPPARRSG